jgi:hypothetical protein
VLNPAIEVGLFPAGGRHDTVHPHVFHQLAVVIGDVPYGSGQGS